MQALNEHMMSLLRSWGLAGCPLFLSLVTGLSIFWLPEAGVSLGKNKFIYLVFSFLYVNGQPTNT